MEKKGITYEEINDLYTKLNIPIKSYDNANEKNFLAVRTFGPDNNTVATNKTTAYDNFIDLLGLTK